MLVLITFLFIITSAFFEVIPYFIQRAWIHKRLYFITASVFVFLSIILFYAHSWQAGVLFTFISTYRLVNLARQYVARLPEKHLRTISLQSFLYLFSLQIVTATLIVSAQYFNIGFFSQDIVLAILAVGSFGGACVILAATISNIIDSKPRPTTSLADSELPTITVAIAARNETPTLVACLESVIASDYPKLEVIVLDDDSQDTTAEIIKSFAQDGVRFVSWEKLNGDWLSKNRAYESLLHHASGELLMYMGVDVRLHTYSLRKIAEQMLTRDVAMMTLVPKRTKSGLIAIFIQPMRYWWELAVPHALRRRPPALSTAWIVNRAKLEHLGGFTSYKRSIIPEEHIARQFYALNSYAFVRTTKDMLITTHKSFASQWDTQVRTRYPHAHRRPEIALVQTLLLGGFVLWPFILLPFASLHTIDTIVLSITAMSAALYIVSHVTISVITNPVAGFFAPINFPIAIALDIVALHVSMYKYEFSKVIWKGRDIAPKKLKVISKLPDLEPISLGSEKTH